MDGRSRLISVRRGARTCQCPPASAIGVTGHGPEPFRPRFDGAVVTPPTGAAANGRGPVDPANDDGLDLDSGPIRAAAVPVSEPARWPRCLGVEPHLPRRGAGQHPCTVTRMTSLSIAFVAYFILALLVGGWGQRKGYSLGVGFLISVLLSFVIGAIVVFMLRDKATGRRGVVTWSDPA